MISCDTEIVVRYAETDQMQFAHHANYIIWFEHGRIRWLKKLGFSYAEMENKGYLIPVLEVKANFFKYALFDEVLKIRTILRNMPKAKICFEYEVFNEKNEMICSGSSLHVFMNKKRKAIKPPRELISKIKSLF